MQQYFGKPAGGEINLGYVRDWWLVDARQVLDVPTPRPAWNGLLPAGGIQLSELAMLTHLSFLPKTASLVEGSEETVDGKRFSLTLTSTLPKPDARLLAWLAQDANTRWVVIWRDFNGKMQVGGEPNNGLRLTWSRQNAGPNNLTMILSGLYTHLAWHINATEIEQAIQDAEFTDEFDNLDFMS